ncbi:MAG: hypothetical protein IAE97_03730 [Chthoniobacterales bacterium]|nr:hypothetical protein [Chthoniobacterales bacterium]
MTTRTIIACLLLVLPRLQAQEPAASASPAPADDAAAPSADDAQVALRARLLDFAGALGNEGFKIRDGYWSGALDAGKVRRLRVNLLAGNQYWFCAAVPEDARGLKIEVYDPAGKPAGSVPHKAPGLAAAGVTAEATGPYFVELQGSAGPSRPFCLIYLFK